MLATLGFALSLALINVDGSIVQQNVRRASAGEELDVAYLASLSTDSVPALVQAFQSDSLPAGTRAAAGAVLACRKYTSPQQPDTDWRAFTLTGFWSESALQKVQPGLKGYLLQTDVTPVTVTSPAGKKFNCQSTTYAD